LLLILVMTITARASHKGVVQSASGEKCLIDTKQVCGEGNGAVMANDFMSPQIELARRVGGGADPSNPNGGQSSTFRGGVSLIGGDHPISVFCDYNARTKKAVYGQLSVGGIPTDADIAELRAGGFCSE
jgi:hypothetical protein